MVRATREASEIARRVLAMAEAMRRWRRRATLQAALEGACVSPCYSPSPSCPLSLPHPFAGRKVGLVAAGRDAPACTRGSVRLLPATLRPPSCPLSLPHPLAGRKVAVAAGRDAAGCNRYRVRLLPATLSFPPASRECASPPCYSPSQLCPLAALQAALEGACVSSLLLSLPIMPSPPHSLAGRKGG